MSRLVLATLWLASLFAVAAASDEPPTFTDEQLRIIARMMAIERECTTELVLARVEKRDPKRMPQCDLGAELAPAAHPASSVLAAPVASAPQRESAMESQLQAATLGAATKTFERGVAPGPTDSALSKSAGQFELTAGPDGGRAAIKLRTDWSGGSAGAFHSLVVSASAPQSKADDGFTNIATLDGLANDFQLGLQLQRFAMPELDPRAADGTLDPTVVKICADAGIDATKAPCGSAAVFKALHERGLDSEYQTYLDKFFDKTKPAHVYGVKGTVGHNTLSFFDPVSLSKQRDDKVPWALGAYASLLYLDPSTRRSLTAGFEFQHDYMNRPTSTRCPNSPSPVLACVTGSFGEPKSELGRLLYLEGRMVLHPSADGAEIPVGIRLTHDLESDDSGVDVPIYLIRDSKGLFNSGVRLGWTNTDHFLFGVFVGATFDLEHE